MKKNVNQLRAGAILSYVNLGIGNIIPFIYTPIMLRILGQSEYGLYGMAASVVAYLSLLNFGIGSTVVRYITKCRAEENIKEEKNIIGLFSFIYILIAVLILVVGSIVSLNPQWYYGNTLDPQQLEKIKILLCLMTFNTAISFPISIFSSIIISHERYIYKKLIDMLSTIISPMLNLVVLFLGFSSVGMTVASTIIQIITLFANVFYCQKVLKIMPCYKNMPFKILKEVFTFSIFIFLGELVNMLYWTTDKVILGAMVGTVAVAIYNIGATFNNIMQQLSLGISSVLTPKITTMVVKGESTEKLTELFIRIGRVQYIIIAFVVSAFIVFGQQFIILWAGEGYSDAFYVALLTMIPVAVPLIQNVGLSIIIAQNKHRFRSIVYAFIAILNIVTTILLIPYFGIIGASLATSIAYFIGPIAIMNWYYYKKTGIDIPLFWKNILKMSIVPVILTIAGIIACKYFVIDSLLSFVLCALIYTVIYFPLFWFFEMNDYEKGIVTEPLKKVIKKLKKSSN